MRTLIMTIACVAGFQIAMQSDATAQCPSGQCPSGQCPSGYANGFIRGMFTGSPPVSHPWHGGYYHQSWGQPLAVVVPPTANHQQTYSWGVGQNLAYPINSQFGRNAPGVGAAPQGSLRPTPAWPSHTDQFGYYYIRAPW